MWRTFAIAVGLVAFCITAAFTIGHDNDTSLVVPAAAMLLVLVMLGDDQWGDHPNRRRLLRPPCSTSRGPRGLVCARAEVLILRLIVGLGAEATATSLGRTPGEVLLDQHRALQTLRGVLAGRGTVPL
ncbi:hypothetical protein [Rhodococcus sp. A14]|uniref:hypothetical protein n=1 Tax=Rhodococcus sp. A14 TaxID=1194106 RepID=UPI00197F7B54